MRRGARRRSSRRDGITSSRSTPDTVARALTIAGSDSGGGAGIQADLKTFSALGVFGMTAITAVTVQNTQGVSGYEELSPRLVGDQIRAVAVDIGVDAAKTGMLASAPIVAAVADAVAETGITNLVVDPVSVSKHGHALLAEDAVDTLRSRILPLARLVTPNLPEAAALAGFDVPGREDMRRAADAIISHGPRAVLVKGGHLEDGGADDLFVDGAQEVWIDGERIHTIHTHGTGCVLSAAIAARLALGDDLLTAVRRGKDFVTQAIRHSLAIGRGIGPVNPLWDRIG
jgi:hydroxymethylpyrimidine/phosphomethylpyrimidine kinase